MSELEWMRIFGDNLRDIIIYNKDSQSSLSKSVGVLQSTISRYIKGVQMPTVINLINLSCELEIDLDELMDFGDIIE